MTLRERLIEAAAGLPFVAYCRLCGWAKGVETEALGEHMYRLHRAICPRLTGS